MRSRQVHQIPLRSGTAAVLLAAGGMLGCGDDGTVLPQPEPHPACGTATARPGEHGITLADECGNHVELQPVVLVSGTWHGGGSDGACAAEGIRTSCPAGGGTLVHAEVEDGVVLTRFEAATDAATTIGGLGLRGEVTIGLAHDPSRYERLGPCAHPGTAARLIDEERDGS